MRAGRRAPGLPLVPEAFRPSSQRCSVPCPGCCVAFHRGRRTRRRSVHSREALPHFVSLSFRGTLGFGQNVGRLRATRMSHELQSVSLRFRGDNGGLSSPFSDFTDWQGSRARLPEKRGGEGEREKGTENAKYQVWERRKDHSSRTEDGGQR